MAVVSLVIVQITTEETRDRETERDRQTESETEWPKERGEKGLLTDLTLP
jgi:hypothetical protein